MKIIKPIILVATILMTFNSFAQESLFSPMKYSNGKGDTLNYRLLFPDYDTIRKYPLVIFLHGSGERGSDNLAQLKWGVSNFATDYNMKMYQAFVLAPQCPKGKSWDSFSRDGKFEYNDTASQIGNLLFELINSTIKNYRIDTNRIYITGLSMGGIGTFDLITRHPNLFAAAAPVCGFGDTSKASVFKHIPIWIFHGAEDAAINPRVSLDMVYALSKAGAHPGYTQYPAVGHFAWLAAYSDPMFFEWLFKQNKANNK
ncbi:MAG: prolyl oligopeptidase family serine peptidase [Bacteroidota bacterium]|nr:prolyl oligopeptidase family serine peptidase [Bacteroidota bacterium]